jgi:hypothetical protein
VDDSRCAPVRVDRFEPFSSELPGTHIQGDIVVGYSSKVSANSKRSALLALINIEDGSPKLLSSNCHLVRVNGGTAVDVQAWFGRLVGWESRHCESLCSVVCKIERSVFRKLA